MSTKSAKENRKLRRLERKRRKQMESRAEEAQPKPADDLYSIDTVSMYRTETVNEEGYHFVRPAWHRWVYGAGRKSEKG